MKIKELKEKKIAILGFGLEWKSTLNFLGKLDFIKKENITVLDKNLREEIQKKLENKWVLYISWEYYLDNLGDFDLIFKTPWISPYHEKIRNYKDKLISNAEIFMEEYTGKIIWITATKGKSTTSTLLYETLKNAWYNVKLVWNIWNPIFDEIDILPSLSLKGRTEDGLDKNTYDYVVYELSSYMLETLKPHLFIWVLWNIYPCHIDWHDNSMEVYKQAKLNLLENAKNIIVNEVLMTSPPAPLLKGEGGRAFSTFWKQGKYSFDSDYFYIDWEKVLENRDIALKWEHNSFNIASVVWVLDVISKTSPPAPLLKGEGSYETLFHILQKTLKNFKWLAHRQEDVWTYKWITFIDDGISTTPESTIEAIKTFWKDIWTIMIWGSDYGFTDESFAKLRSYIEDYKIDNIVLFIDTGSRVFGDISKQMKVWEEHILSLKNNYSPKLFKTDSMQQAIKFVYKNTKEKKYCLMSSASPSFSLWKGYIQKGEEYKKYIEIYGR